MAIMLNFNFLSKYFYFMALLLPSFVLADVNDSEKTLTDALVHVLKSLNRIDNLLDVLAVLVGLLILVWALLQAINKDKNQQITWKGIGVRILAAGLLMGGLFSLVEDINASIHYEDATANQVLQQRNRDSEFVDSESVKSCVSGNSKSKCAMY